MYLQVVLVLGLLGLVVYLTTTALTVPTGSGTPASTAGVWRVAHRDESGRTHVLVEKLSATGDLLDEHLVATIAAADPAYDEKFLAAMATARERRALFESEQ